MKAKRRKIPEDIRNIVFKRDDHKCCYCKTTSYLTIDHIVAHSKTQDDSISNLQTLCVSCNVLKGDKANEKAKLVFSGSSWFRITYESADENGPIIKELILLAKNEKDAEAQTKGLMSSHTFYSANELLEQR